MPRKYLSSSKQNNSKIKSGKSRPLITLLSDFGSLYPAQLKGVILGINADARLVDISHDIPAQDISGGAFALMVSVPYFPPGSIHLAVVDPGVGTARRPVVIEAGGHLFVGPDNGLLIPAARGLSNHFIVREITRKDLFLKVSATFHGRDIFAPVAAHLSRGMLPAQIGVEIPDFVNLDFGYPIEEKNKVTCRIIYVDRFGNIITNIPGEWVQEKFSTGSILKIKEIIIPLVYTFTDVDIGAPLMLVGSHGYLEIAVNSGHASGLLEVSPGDLVEINLL